MRDPIGRCRIEQTDTVPGLDPPSDLDGKLGQSRIVANVRLARTREEFVGLVDHGYPMAVMTLHKAVGPAPRIDGELLFELDGADEVHAGVGDKILERGLGSITTRDEQIQPLDFASKVCPVSPNRFVAFVAV